MKPLRNFFMEDYLENFRFQSEFNLGESGGWPRSTQDLLVSSGLTQEKACEIFLNTKLFDSPNRGRDDLRELVSKMHPGSTKGNILITTGTSEALFLLFRYLKPESVALALPAFQLLYELPLALDAKIIPLPIRWNEKGMPFIDEEEWISTLENQKPSCLLINNPHNPSGLVLSSAFLERLSQTAEKIKCTLIGDEHYRFLSHASQALGSTVYKSNGTTFVTGSFIKCLGSPGLRIGWCVGPKEALDNMQNEKNYTTHTVNPFSEWISFEVLKNLNSDLFQTMKQEWIQNKSTLESFLKNSNFIYGVAPEGGLVTSLGIRNADPFLNLDNFDVSLLKKGVFVLPLSSMEFGKFEFQKNLTGINKGYGFRLGLGMKTEKFKDSLIRIEETFLDMQL